MGGHPGKLPGLRRALQRPRMRSIPLRIRLSFSAGTLPALSVRVDLSIAVICETLATESLGNPVIFALKAALPGACAQSILLVRGTQTTVRIELRFMESPWTITTGLLYPGSEPIGWERSAHHISPREGTTIRYPEGARARLALRTRIPPSRLSRRPGSWIR